MGNVHGYDIKCGDIRGKEFLKLFKVLSRIMKVQMFDVTAQLVNNQEEINCLDKILWGKNSWTRLSLIDDEVVINLQRTKVYVFSDSVLCSERFFNIPNPTKLGRTGLQESDPRKATEIMMLSTESRLNSSGTFSPGFTTLQLCDKINDLLSNLGQTPATFTGRILFMSIYVNVQ